MIGRFIGLAFRFLWLLVAATAIPTGRSAALSICVAGAALFLLAGWRVLKLRRRNPNFRRAYYIAAVILEFVALFAAQRWLAARGLQDFQYPVIGVIVGLHFIGLWLATGSKRFLWLTGTMVALNAVAILLPMSSEGRTLLSGFGSSAALLITAST